MRAAEENKSALRFLGKCTIATPRLRVKGQTGSCNTTMGCCLSQRSESFGKCCCHKVGCRADRERQLKATSLFVPFCVPLPNSHSHFPFRSIFTAGYNIFTF